MFVYICVCVHAGSLFIGPMCHKPSMTVMKFSSQNVFPHRTFFLTERDLSRKEAQITVTKVLIGDHLLQPQSTSCFMKLTTVTILETPTCCSNHKLTLIAGPTTNIDVDRWFPPINLHSNPAYLFARVGDGFGGYCYSRKARGKSCFSCCT